MYKMAENNVSDIDLVYTRLGMKIALGNGLIEKLAALKNVRGIDKLKKKIQREINALKKVFQNKMAKENNVNCTNLKHFEALVNCLMGCEEITAVLETFYFDDSEIQQWKKVVVDIICENGKKWIKVIARDPKALTQLSNGNGTFGKRNVLDQVKDYIQTSHQHPCVYRTPEVVFHFASGIESILANQLNLMGITVSGEVIAVDVNDHENYMASSLSESDDEVLEYNGTLVPLQSFGNNNTSHETCRKLNLDVTTMLAYVSALTNTDPALAIDYMYRHPYLREQAEVELKQPVKPILEDLFEGKELVCCQSAASSFTKIVDTVGGPSEIARAKQLMEKVRIVADNPTLPANYSMYIGGHISERSLTVFSTGHNLQAITVSANESFVRSAKSQGVEFATFIHSARALTEKKMLLSADNVAETVGSTNSCHSGCGLKMEN